MTNSIVLKTIFNIDDVLGNYPELTMDEVKKVLISMEKIAQGYIRDFCYEIMSECVDEILSENGKQI